MARSKSERREIIVPVNALIGKLTALERCVAEVTKITENATTVSFQFDDVVELSKVEKRILIELLRPNRDIVGEKIRKMGSSALY